MISRSVATARPAGLVHGSFLRPSPHRGAAAALGSRIFGG